MSVFDLAIFTTAFLADVSNVQKKQVTPYAKPAMKCDGM